MTVTETPPEAASDTSAPTADAALQPAPPTGLAAIVGSGDHKVLGRLYIGFSLLFGVVALVAGLLVSVDRIDGTLGNRILTADTWNQAWTFQSIALVFLFLVPLFLGLAFTIVPLQVGADGIAFPRAAAASFWGWLLGSGTFVASYAINGGPGGGSADGVGLWAASFVMLLAAIVLGAICVVTTVFALRPDGMSLDRAPMFSWSMLVAGVMWILTIPVLIGTLVLIYVDHRYGQKFFGLNGPEMFTRIAWALHQPQLYAFAVPVLGIASEIVPVAARARQPQRQVTLGAIAAFGVLGFGAFLQATIYPTATTEPLYVAMAVLAVLPVLAVVGGIGSVISAGKPRMMSPLVAALAASLTLLIAAVLGAVSAVERFDLQGTIYDLGQSNMVLFAALTAAVGGIFYWATKISGHQMPEGAGVLAGVVLLGGTVLASVPYVIAGALGDGAEANVGIEGLNIVSSAGYGLVLLGVFIAIGALLEGVRRSDDVPGDPWEGHTLEWLTSSPPASDNFAEAPRVRSAEPLLDVAGSDSEEGSA